jgi:Flp pilus assembly pilin Flp
MQDQLTRIAVTTELWRMDAADRMRATRERLADQKGQTAAEYLGIILLVAVIIAAVVGSGIAGDITDRLGKLVENIGKGDTPEGAPSPDGR